MALNTQSFAEWRQLLSIAYNESALQPALDIPGEPLDAIFNAVALLATQIQSEIEYEDTISRLASIPNTPEPNPDIDSFCTPFGYPRLDGAAAIVPVIWSIPSPTLVPLTLPQGIIVQTAVGLPQVRYASDSVVVIPSGQSSVAGEVVCTVVGTIGNVQAGQINQVVSGPSQGPSLPGGLSVTNPNDVDNGMAVELNAAYKARFTTSIQTGKTGSQSAIAAAILGVQPQLTYSIGDRLNASGETLNGAFTVFVAPIGSSPPTSTGLLLEVSTAIEGNPSQGIPQVRSAGIQFEVLSPSGLAVDASAVITTIPKLPAGVTQASVIAACASAYQSYIEAIGLDPQGNPTVAPIFGVGAMLYGVPYVQRVDNLLLNGTTSDVTAGYGVLMYPGSINFTAA
jgi:hypothetical protein